MKIKIRKILYFLWFSFTIALLIWKGGILGWQQKTADFYNYYTASKLVLQGKPIHKFYNNNWFNEEAQKINIQEGAKFSPFPPVTAYLFIPLTVLSPITAKRLWLLINFLLIMALPFRIRNITKWSFENTLLFLTLFTLPLASTLNSGQIYLVIGFALLEIIGNTYHKKRGVLIGVIIGFSASLKYLPILFLAYITKNQKRITIILVTMLTILFSSIAIYVNDNLAFPFFFEHFNSHIQGKLPGQGQYSVAFQSLDSLLNNLFVYNTEKNPSPLIHSITIKTILKLLLKLVILAIVFILYKKNKYKITPVLISIGMLGIFSLLPATASYHLLLLLFPLTIIFLWVLNLNSPRKTAVFFVITLIALNLQSHHIPNFNKLLIFNLLIHYPRFWGVLFLFFLTSFYYRNYPSRYYG
ncbi:glycosyltransferase family 87 protein [Tenacibaculum xiamenense]|uniref:glycosyltransferase family 87 protein n=1 Tax=Tenacibaculum xiamenense TaxID=1261553 RepID=UPI0038960B0C